MIIQIWQGQGRFIIKYLTVYYRYGRKIVFVFCILLMSLTGIAQAIASDYVTFQIFVFVNALGTSGVYPLAFILGAFDFCVENCFSLLSDIYLISPIVRGDKIEECGVSRALSMHKGQNHNIIKSERIET